MHYFPALRLQALKAVMAPDEEANLRYIMRWYSRNYHTPLHVVETLPLEDIYQTFYEHTYEELDEADRKQELADLLETPEEKRAKERAKDEERAEIFEYARQIAEQERKKEEKKRLADLKPEQKQSLMAPKQAPQSTLPKTQLNQAIKDMKELPPNIEMRFISEEEMERELEGYGSMMPGSKPQSSE